jgi:AraC-like DNA-binding protein
MREGIEAARQTNHSYSMAYVLGVAGCALSLWLGNLDDTRQYLQVMTENAVNNPTLDQLRQCWQLILRLREGCEREALIAAHIESRVDMSTFIEISALAYADEIPLPGLDDDIGDALWCLPEALRARRIALACGFVDQSHLTRAFSIRGVQPRQVAEAPVSLTRTTRKTPIKSGAKKITWWGR